MAYISVTNALNDNSATSDITLVGANFTDIVNGLSDGTKDLNVGNITASRYDPIKVDTISEKTADTGVTIDSVVLKDGLSKMAIPNILVLGNVWSCSGSTSYAEIDNTGRFYGDFKASWFTVYFDMSHTGGGGDGGIEIYNITDSSQVCELAVAGGTARGWGNQAGTFANGAKTYAVRIKTTGAGQFNVNKVYIQLT